MTAVMAAPVALEPVPIAGSLPLEDAPTAAPPPGTPDASHSAPEQTRRSSAASEDTAPSGTETGGETVFMSCYLAALKRCEAKYTDPFQAAHAAPTDAPPLATTKLRILCPDEERAAPLSPAPQHTEQHVPTDAPAATGDAPAPAPIQAPVVQASGPYVCAQPGVVAGPGGTFQQIYILQPTAAGPVLAPAHAPAPAVQAHTHAAPVTSPQRAAKRTREAAAVQPARGDAAARSPEHTGSSAAPCKLCGVPSMPAGQGFCGCALSSSCNVFAHGVHPRALTRCGRVA